MAKIELYKYYEGLPTWAKGVVIIGVLIIIIILIFWIRRTIKNIKEASEKAEKEQEFIQDYQIYCQAYEGQMSYPATSYLTMADKIEQAGCPYTFCLGTDTQVIKDTFKQLNTTCDAILLTKAFGARPDPGCFELLSCKKLTLGAWLATELNDADIREINNEMKKKNINFKI